MLLPNEFSIYQGTTRIGRIGGDTPREAWYAARYVVRALAHADGVGSETTITASPGRPGNIQHGIFRALLTVRVDQ